MSEEKVSEKRIGLLEKVGHVVMRRMGQTCPEGTTWEEQRVLTSAEQDELKSIVRWAIFRAALAGALSALAAAISAVFAERWFADEKLYYWMLFGGVSAVAAAIEVGYLYYDALRAVHRISRTCDVELFPESEQKSAMAGAMVRAAMELPNPPDQDPYVNPFREASKLNLLVGVLLYKGKIMLSNALVKILIRKIFTRGAARAWLEFVAIPVTAIWNAVICFWVMREARIRAIGPSAVTVALRSLLVDENRMELAESAQRAVGCCVTASRDLHPNHLSMLHWLRRESNIEVSQNVDDRSVFFQRFREHEIDAQKILLELLALAIVVDGRVAKSEREMMQELLAEAGMAGDTASLRVMLHSFRHGQGIPRFLAS